MVLPLLINNTLGQQNYDPASIVNEFRNSNNQLSQQTPATGWTSTIAFDYSKDPENAVNEMRNLQFPSPSSTINQGYNRMTLPIQSSGSNYSAQLAMEQQRRIAQRPFPQQSSPSTPLNMTLSKESTPVQFQLVDNPEQTPIGSGTPPPRSTTLYTSTNSPDWNYEVVSSPSSSTTLSTPVDTPPRPAPEVQKNYIKHPDTPSSSTTLSTPVDTPPRPAPEVQKNYIKHPDTPSSSTTLSTPVDTPPRPAPEVQKNYIKHPDTPAPEGASLTNTLSSPPRISTLDDYTPYTPVPDPPPGSVSSSSSIMVPLLCAGAIVVAFAMKHK
jgi:hypothetical protein